MNNYDPNVMQAIVMGSLVGTIVFLHIQSKKNKGTGAQTHEDKAQQSKQAISFGDDVRILSDPTTESAGIAGRTGTILGHTMPSVSKMDVLGELDRDFAINVFFEGLKTDYWLDPKHVEFKGFQPGQTIKFDGVDTQWIRNERGDWDQKIALVNAEWLWNELHDLFDTDDGTLPDINVGNLSAMAICKAYALIRKESELVSTDAYIWDNELNQQVTLDADTNYAEWVVTDKGQPFHFVIGNLKQDSVAIPELGVFIFRESIAFDYQMGKEWNADNVYALFGFLKRIVDFAPDAKITLDAVEEVERRFANAWERFCNRH